MFNDNVIIIFCVSMLKTNKKKLFTLTIWRGVFFLSAGKQSVFLLLYKNEKSKAIKLSRWRKTKITYMVKLTWLDFLFIRAKIKLHKKYQINKNLCETEEKIHKYLRKWNYIRQLTYLHDMEMIRRGWWFSFGLEK